MERRRPIQVTEAVEAVMKYARRGLAETVPLEKADGRFLYEDVAASHAVPPFDRSPYDGFAIKSADARHASRQNPVKLKVIAEIGAGDVSGQHIRNGEAVRIMTGAAIPSGADCVIMLELVNEFMENGAPVIEIKRRMSPGENISRRGEDAEEGRLLLQKGTVVHPGVTALLATFGYSYVKAVKPPLIGVLATGSELLDVPELLLPGKIRNSNGPMAASQILNAGGLFRQYGIIKDDPDSVYDSVCRAAKECDAVITTGGVSVGDFDFLPEVYRRLGASVLFNKIAMRPGSVTSCAMLEGKPLFGLSGNPSACFVGFELLVRPYIQHWLYSPYPHLRNVEGFLATDFPKPNPFARFVRSRLEYNNGTILARPVGLDKSSAVSSLAEADCLAVLPGGTRGYCAGDRVDILLLNDRMGSDSAWQAPLSSR